MNNSEHWWVLGWSKGVCEHLKESILPKNEGGSHWSWTGKDSMGWSSTWQCQRMEVEETQIVAEIAGPCVGKRWLQAAPYQLGCEWTEYSIHGSCREAWWKDLTASCRPWLHQSSAARTPGLKERNKRNCTSPKTMIGIFWDLEAARWCWNVETLCVLFQKWIYWTHVLDYLIR